MTSRPRLAAAATLLFAFNGLASANPPSQTAGAAPATAVKSQTKVTKPAATKQTTPATTARQTAGRATAAPTTGAAAAPREVAEASDGTSEADLLVTVRLEEIRAQRDAYEAQQLVDRAVREEVRGREEEAEALYARAIELDPDNRTAQLGMAATRDRLGLVADRLPLMERAEREARAKRQEVMYRFDAAINAAIDGIATGTPEGFQKARLEIDRARLARAAAPDVFSAEDAEELDARLADQDLALEAAIQNRADAIRRARRKEMIRDIKAARVKDIRLE